MVARPGVEDHRRRRQSILKIGRCDVARSHSAPLTRRPEYSSLREQAQLSLLCRFPREVKMRDWRALAPAGEILCVPGVFCKMFRNSFANNL